MKIMLFRWLLPALFMLGASATPRTFGIDYANNTFVKDGKPFRYLSGSIHYFRVPRELWADRLAKVKAMGFNTIQTYIQWNLHEPQPGQFTFEGNLDFEAYFEMANQMGLLVLLRAGPYVCGEVNFGGFPYWLLKENPNMALRTNDPGYLAAVDRWWSVMYGKLKKHLYQNGGPIIMVQVENEYGSYALQTDDCSQIEYLSHLRDYTRQALGDDVVIYTTDGAGMDYMRCGNIPQVYPTVDFGPGANVTEAFEIQRFFAPQGPLINSEFYPGWLDHWGMPHSTTPIAPAVKTLDEMLAAGANVNVYMIHGGTSFGYLSGANDPSYAPQPTSYDYDAPISEAGELTDKYFALKEVVKKYFPIPDMNVPKSNPKADYGPVDMTYQGTIFDLRSNAMWSPTQKSDHPMTFEELSQDNGYVLYEYMVTDLVVDPSLLSVPTLHDRGYVFVNQVFVGTLGRSEGVNNLSVRILPNEMLQILVASQGRVNYGASMGSDRKGILSNVTLNGKLLSGGWNMTGLPLLNLTSDILAGAGPQAETSLLQTRGAVSFWSGMFTTPCKDTHGNDTFLSLPTWGKGLAFVNGFNLGRYWPNIGPQQTLYVPSSLIKPTCQPNELVLFEEEGSWCPTASRTKGCPVHLVSMPIINGTTPGSNQERRITFQRDYL